MKRRIAAFSFALVLGLALCLTLTVRGTVLSAEKARSAGELKVAQEFYSRLEAERFSSLEAETRLLATLPQVKVVMSTRNTPTVVEELEGFRAMIHADFLHAFDENDKIHGTVDHEGLAELLKQAKESGHGAHGYVVEGESLIQAVAIPVTVGGRYAGTLVAGHSFGEDVLGSIQKMSGGEFAVLSPSGKLLHATKGISDEAVKHLDSLGAEPSFHGGFVAVSAVLAGPAKEKAGFLISMRPLSEGMKVAATLRLNLLAISGLFCILGVLISVMLARSISRPLRGLSARLCEVDPTDLTSLRQVADDADSIAADKDVRSLMNSFGAVLSAVSQQKERAETALAERAQSLEVQLEAVRTDNVKLSEANRRLIKLIEKSREKLRGEEAA